MNILIKSCLTIGMLSGAALCVSLVFGVPNIYSLIFISTMVISLFGAIIYMIWAD